MDEFLERNDLTLDEEMQLSKGRTACVATKPDGSRYYIIYLGKGAQASSKEQAKTMLIDELEKRFS